MSTDCPTTLAKCRVGVSSFSFPTAFENPERLVRALENLAGCSLSVVEGQTLRVKTGFYAGTKEERASDLNAFIESDEVDLILSCIGGYGCIQLLDLINFDSRKLRSKLFLGYSDFTIVLNAIHAMCGIETFLGPALLPSFGEVDGLNGVSAKSLDLVLSREDCSIYDSEWFSDETLKWGTEDSLSRARVPNYGRKTVKEGYGQGVLIGGNLDSFCCLLGTRFCPIHDKIILMIEEYEQLPLYLFERNLYKIRTSHIWSKIEGVLIGRFSRKAHPDVQIMTDNIVGECFADKDVPIVSGLDFGHTEPVKTMPIGRFCTIDGSNIHLSLRDLS